MKTTLPSLQLRQGLGQGALLLLLLLLFLALLLAALATWGQWRWRVAAQDLQGRLQAQDHALDSIVPPYQPEQLAGLPAPVQRYLRKVLQPGQRPVAGVVIEHSGSFNLSASGEQWKPFTSRQDVVVQHPGFVWDARIQMLPGVAVRVHDAYLGGQGLLHAAVLGLFSMADLQGGGELARGELMRWLAETAWYPTALLPGQGVRWAARDAHSALLTLSDAGNELTLTMFFGEDDLIHTLRAEARGRIDGGTVQMAPWEGRWSDYQWHDGLLVPMRGEVAWLLPEGRKPYWRGSITALRHRYVE